MYDRNEMTNIVQHLNLPVDKNYKDKVYDELKKLKRINSYIIYAQYFLGMLTGIEIHYNVSQKSKYNTLRLVGTYAKICNQIDEFLNNPTGKTVVGYGQADLTFLIKQFEPLILKLSKEQKQRWQYLEFEDLTQMCSLVICDLYYKGYYIHKRLIYRAFNNYVLMHIRKDKSRPEIISLEQEYSKSDDDSKLTIKDMIPDVEALNKEEDEYNYEIECKILDEMKSIVIDIIGPRQYDQMLREYTNKQTTNWSRKLMQTIKAKLYDLGINAKSFNKYYN